MDVFHWRLFRLVGRNDVADFSQIAIGGVGMIVLIVGWVEAAKKLGAAKGLLLDHYTSYDIMPGDSFVGYAGVVLAG